MRVRARFSLQYHDVVVLEVLPIDFTVEVGECIELRIVGDRQPRSVRTGDVRWIGVRGGRGWIEVNVGHTKRATEKTVLMMM